MADMDDMNMIARLNTALERGDAAVIHYPYRHRITGVSAPAHEER